jgi:hypothetical protein
MNLFRVARPISLDSRARFPVLLRLYLQLLASSDASTTVAEHGGDGGGDCGSGRVRRLGRVFWHLVEPCSFSCCCLERALSSKGL